MQPLTGEVLDGRYELLDVIGTGGMAIVYRASELGAGREVAVKILRRSKRADRRTVGRFEREASLSAQLQHPNNIRIFDFGVSGHGLFLVMELLRGGTLADRLFELGPLTPRPAAAVAVSIASALAEAHAVGIVHRDLKPANIYLHRGERGTEVKVLDYGIAKLMRKDRKKARRTTAAGRPLYQTTVFEGQAAQTLGSVHYQPTEQTEGGAVDGRTDLYALGALLYTMITGNPPFLGANAMMVLMSHALDPPPALPDSVPEGLRGLAQRLLAKSPDDRPASAAAVCAELRRILSETRPA